MHLTDDKELFIQGSIKKCRYKIYGIDNTKAIKSKYKGSVRYTVGSLDIILPNVLYTPIKLHKELPTLLISTNKLCDLNLGTYFRHDKSTVEIKNVHDITIATFTTTSNLYTHYLHKTPETVYARETHIRDYTLKTVKRARTYKTSLRDSTTKIQVGIKRLHERTHAAPTSHIMRLTNKGKTPTMYPCDACAFSKAKFKPRPKQSTRKAKRVGERLHYDVFTFTSTPARKSRDRYLLVVVDEYSKYTWTEGMTHKSQVFQILRALIQRVSKHIQTKIGAISYYSGVGGLRSDNAGENINERMKIYCGQKGIKIESTVPHTPYQNGLAERMGGHLINGGLALQYGGNLPRCDWLTSVKAYNHVHNRLPDKYQRTPWEKYHSVEVPWEKQTAHLRRIGSLCYKVKPHNIRKAHTHKADRCILLGYGDEAGSKSYIVRNLSTGEVSRAAHNQLQIHEDNLVFPKPTSYDHWLKNQWQLKRHTLPIIKESKQNRTSSTTYSRPNTTSTPDETDETDETNQMNITEDVEAGGDIQIDVEFIKNSEDEQIENEEIEESGEDVASDEEIEVEEEIENELIREPLRRSRRNRIPSRIGLESVASQFDTRLLRKILDHKSGNDEQIINVYLMIKSAKRIQDIQEELSEDVETGKCFHTFTDRDIHISVEEAQRKWQREAIVLRKRIRTMRRKTVMNTNYANEFKKAENTEFDQFTKHQVWTLIKRPEGKNVIDVKWVYDIKIADDESITKFKARLVARGFQQETVMDIFAPMKYPVYLVWEHQVLSVIYRIQCL